MRSISLNGAWEAVCIRPNGETFTMNGEVPGCSVSDLQREGKLPTDLFWRDNAEAVQTYEDCDFEYTKTFECAKAAGERYSLNFERLDTYCKLTLNGKTLAKTEDGHIPYSFDVTDLLRDGGNTFCARFRSPIKAVEGLPLRPGAFTTERLYTRRTQCTYGWDWVGRFVSCGITGNAALIARRDDEAILDGAYVYTRMIDEDGAGLGIDLSFETRLPARVLTVEVIDPNGAVCGTTRRYCNEPLVRLNLDIAEPMLWYPLGYGNQPLYTLTVRDGENELYREKFGIRTVRILQLPDLPDSEAAKKCAEIKNPHYDFNEGSSGFVLKVNGVRILCKGANWVPCEPFTHGSTDAKITRALELAKDCGLNMLRVWGGGTFETKHFYSECSRLGILVTQDFLMACGVYPEEEDWFIAHLRDEAKYAAKLMRNQPCLMWWSGDNENAVEGCDTDANYSGRRSAYEGIAPILYRMDPYRPFLPSSPFGGKKYASNTVGTTHNTQFLGTDILPYMLGDDCSDYREHWKRFRARFIAEEPQLGAVSLGSLRKVMNDADIFGDDDAMWRYHTKTNPGLDTHLYDISTHFAQKLLGDFEGAEDRLFKMRYLQYEWIRLTMEQLRRETGFQSGLIYWMYNDCWPAASGWALVDYYNKPKDAWYAFKRCAKPVVLSLDAEGEALKLYVSNMAREAVSVQATLYAVKHDAFETLGTLDVRCEGGSTAVCDTGISKPDAGTCVIADIGSDRTFYTSGAPVIVPASVEVKAEADAVIVHAESYVHAVELEADAVFEDNCFSLLPGETRRIKTCSGYTENLCVTAYTLNF